MRLSCIWVFKRDDTAEAALKQINDKEYSLPFAADNRQLYKIGVAFDSESRMLSGWKEE
ncbi:MAG: PD-(D/E)XK nuclease domain-containing protein [Lachnospiraceae bacterium]|nr:PD-(D/E)XK nuclease domain-containing protein [Lachnospiraceae bacterium]